MRLTGIRSVPPDRLRSTTGRRLRALLRPLMVARRSDPAVPSGIDNTREMDTRSAMAQAVRQQLTNPGSISHQQQLVLTLADRGIAAELALQPVGASWSPFSVVVDYRPVPPATWLTSIDTV